MANQDIGFYKYLEAAFRYRLFNSQGMTATLETRFNYLGYNLPFNRIFFYARRVLPKFYTGEFPDTEEGNLQMARKVLEKLDKHQDIELEKYFTTAVSEENIPIITEATQESAGIQQTGAGQAMPGGLPSMPTASAPRVSMPHIAVVQKETQPAAESAAKTAEKTEAPTVITRARNIQTPSFLKTFGSNAQIFAKRNLGRIADGLKGIVGGVGRGLGGAMSSGLGAAAPSLGRMGHGLANGLQRISAPGGIGGGGIGKGLSKSSNKLALGLLGGLLLFVLISGLLGAITGSSPSLKAAPIPGSSSLDYFIPFRNSDVRVANPDAIKAQVRNSWPNAQLQNWDIIVAESIARNWNPAFVLALWIEETGAQGVASYNDPLGCAPNQPTTDINISLACLFNNFSNFSNDQFGQFMAKYSGGPASAPFSNNPNFPKNIKDWYSKLVPSGPGAIQIISQPPSGIASDCPVPGGIISFPSYNPATNTGHCGSDYSYSYCLCGTSGRRAKAIDVRTGGPSSKDIVLPTISGQTVNWTLINTYNVVEADGGGKGYTFKSSDNWYLDMLHLSQTLLTGGTEYPSGTIVAKTIGDHVHMTIGKDINNALNPASIETDCDPGWMASDFMCQ